MSNNVPELLAPAGDWEALRAAVQNGADAVYFGLPRFSARQRAANFTPEELPKVIEYLHRHNVRGYVAFNTLVFEAELPQAAQYVEAIAQAGADAVIVQDLGLTRLVHRMAPTLAIHASTQMTLTEPRAIEMARRLGVSRVILPRELSLAEIEQIAGATDIELEVFVHGALCVSYSGQCLVSESLWGRSANRGLCAQACRLPYGLVLDDKELDVGERPYLLSTKDLAAYDLIGELLRLGVKGFKIEGRLKSAHYVAAATQAYRQAIDAAGAGQAVELSAAQERELAQSFSRGFCLGFLRGADHQQLVHGLFPKSRGVRIGRVAAISARGVIVELDSDGGARGDAAVVRPGDGVVFDEGHPDQDEQGGRVYEVLPALGQADRRNRSAKAEARKPHGRLELTFGSGDVNLGAVAVGSVVWKTDDPRLRREWEKSFARDVVVRPEPLEAHLSAQAGRPPVLEFRDASGNAVEVAGEQPLAEAINRPLTLEVARQQLGRLGGTPFELGALVMEGLQGPADVLPVMAPVSVLNDLRRRGVEKFLRLRDARAQHAVVDAQAIESLRQERAPRLPQGGLEEDAADKGSAHQDSFIRLHVLARQMGQLDALLQGGLGAEAVRAGTIYCDFEDLAQYPDAVRRLRQAGMSVGLAGPRILKPGDESWLRQLAECRPDAVLVRNLGSLDMLRQLGDWTPTLVGDFSLNAANSLSVDWLLQAGLRRVVPGYDLNRRQLHELLSAVDAAALEVVIHQHVPMLHTEHCLYAACLSDGSDNRACGRPCGRGRLALQDRRGRRHVVVADHACRNTVFNATAQTAAGFLPDLLQAGVRHLRLEFLDEDAATVAAVISSYARLMAGELSPAEALRQVVQACPGGADGGTFDFD